MSSKAILESDREVLENKDINIFFLLTASIRASIWSSIYEAAGKFVTITLAVYTLCG